MKFKKFEKKDRSSFNYWFNHWKAYNWVAWRLGVWSPRFLLHDIEKPWLMWLWKDYPKVQKYHRTHSRHHLAYQGKKERDWLGIVLDWECSRYTKIASPRTARQEAERVEREGTIQEATMVRRHIYPVLIELGL